MLPDAGRLAKPLPAVPAVCRACHVAVGTTGRMLSLIQRGTLRTDSVHLLVLDEADKLLAGAPQLLPLLPLPAHLVHCRRA